MPDSGLSNRVSNKHHFPTSAIRIQTTSRVIASERP
jgi:hypothetical protein